MQVIKKFGKIFLIFTFFFWVFSVYAEPYDHLDYQGEVPVSSYSSADWLQGTRWVFEQVLMKLRGVQKLQDIPEIKRAVKDAGTFVTSYNYAKDRESGVITLQVRFSEEMMHALLDRLPEPKRAPGSPNAFPGRSALHASSSERSRDASRSVGNASLGSVSHAPAIVNGVRSIEIVVSGVNNLKDFAKLVRYLRQLDGVVEVRSRQTRGSYVLLELSSRASPEALDHLIEKDHRLIKTTLKSGSGADIASSVLAYRWSPVSVTWTTY